MIEAKIWELDLPYAVVAPSDRNDQESDLPTQASGTSMRKNHEVQALSAESPLAALPCVSLALEAAEDHL